MTITCQDALAVAIAWPLLVQVTPKRLAGWWWVIIAPMLVAVACGFRLEVVHQ